MKKRLLLLPSVLLGVAAAAVLPSDGNVDEEFRQLYPISAHGRVSLHHVNGHVRIAAWDRNEVSIEGVKHSLGHQILNGARIVADSRPDAITIETQYSEEDQDSRSVSIDYTVLVPRHACLDGITLVNGGLDIEGVAGDVRASSVNGTIQAKQLGGGARLSTINGRLEASFKRLDPAKTISLNSINGSIRLYVPHDAHAQFTASNIAGGISNDFGLPVIRSKVAGSRLDGVLRHGGARIRLDTVNGCISIVPVAHGRRVRFT